MSTLLVLLLSAALLTCLVGLVRGRVRTVGLHGRRRSAQGLGLSLVALAVVGASLPGPVEERAADAATQASGSPAPAAPSAGPSPSSVRTAAPAQEPAAQEPPARRAPAASAPAPRPTAAGGQDDGAALALLHRLAVKGRAPRTGYSREQFGQRWADTDRNGCDTRNDVLRRDLTDVVLKAGTRGCVVLSGTRADPYTGRVLSFSRDDPQAVQVDHVVSLSDAWQTGAATWPERKRVAFANDPLNLLAVDGPTNAAKSDGDAATWLPPSRPGRCPLVARQVAVKAKYGLWVKPAERDAVVRVLAGCPGAAVPTGGLPTLAPTSAPRAAASRAAAPPTAEPAPVQEPQGGRQVTPGAFCAPEGATGTGRRNGRPYTCTREPGEERARWRP